MKYKKGEKYWIYDGGGITQATIMKVFTQNDVTLIKFKIAFSGKQISFLANLFGAYYVDIIPEAKFEFNLIK